MDPLTFAFDLAAAIGGLYLLIGLVLHLIAAWKSCIPTRAVGAPLALGNQPLRPGQRGHEQSELDQLTDWDRRFGLT